jgi:2-dehydro-3-deoxygluconokinase
MTRHGVVCFGELLLRLSAPGREQLLQSQQFRAFVGGAEANVAVSLALFGHDASMVSVVPDSSLGEACIGELRRYGVRTEGIRKAPGRLGLYFLATGAGHRASEVLYDRADSAFALAAPELIDWERELTQANWLHISGITPALGLRASTAALRAARAARERGMFVSFDCNYRAKLWEAWGGDAAAGMRQLAELAHLIFAEDRALGLMLGEDFARVPEPDRFRHACDHAFAAFPLTQRIAATVRSQFDVDHHELSAVMASRNRMLTTRVYSLTSIVDRIGSGDAFAAGVLHGIETGMDDQATLDFALAAACLKHSVPGDFNLVSAADVRNLVADQGFDVRR